MTLIARMNQTCPWCRQTIKIGDVIAWSERGWIHGPLNARCREARNTKVYIEMEESHGRSAREKPAENLDSDPENP